jgi:all-trans-retinol 13,14-reductase
MPHALIIGSGISGLTSAVLLAEHGWQVTVLEAHAIPGGLMQRFRRGPFWFDTGFHFITGSPPGGIFRQLAQRLGILQEMRFLPLDEERQFRFHLPDGGEFAMPVGLERAAAALAQRWPEQAGAIQAFFTELRGQLAGNPWLGGLVPAGTPAGTHDRHGSVSDALARCGVGGLPADVIGSLAGILAMRPERCPLDLFAAFGGTAITGCWRAEGGGEAIIAPLLARLAALGGTLLLRSGAERIHWQDKTVSAVEDVQGRMHACDLVIASCHPAEILRLTGEGGMRPSLSERIRSTPDSASAILVYASLTTPPAALGSCHHFARTSTDGDLYFIAPSNFHHRSGDGGDGGDGSDGSVDAGDSTPPYLEAMLWVAPEQVADWRGSALGKRADAYLAWKREREQEILAAVTALHPTLTGTVERVWSASPLSIEHYVRSRRGAAMGLSHDIGHLGSEPIPRRNRLRNLCFAGQSAGHPGVVGCMISSVILCESVLGIDLRSGILASSGR